MMIIRLITLILQKKFPTELKSKKSEIGILVCGSGTGMAISANKIKGIRAAVCYNSEINNIVYDYIIMLILYL